MNQNDPHDPLPSQSTGDLEGDSEGKVTPKASHRWIQAASLAGYKKEVGIV